MTEEIKEPNDIEKIRLVVFHIADLCTEIEKSNFHQEVLKGKLKYMLSQYKILRNRTRANNFKRTEVELE